MLDFLRNLFNTTGFPRRWDCGVWTPGQGWLHIISDLAIWSAYFTIPLILVYFVYRRRDIPFRSIFLLFGAFILACGTTHLMDAIIFWWPAYRLAGMIKLITAIASWATVFALFPIIPKALTLRSPNAMEEEVKRRTGELAQANQALLQSEQLLRFQADASKSLANLVDYQSTMQRVVGLAVPRFADGCAAHIADGDGQLRQVAAMHVDPAKAEVFEQLGRRVKVDPMHPIGPAQVFRTGKAEVVSQIPHSFLESSATDGEHLRILQDLKLKSYMCVPLAVRERILGTLTFIATESRAHYTADDLALAEDLGHRAAVAIDNARLYAQAREADRRKDEFLAMLAHELRNPLAPIRSGLDLLSMDGAGDANKDTVDIMQEQIRHLVRLVDDLMDVSRIIRGKIQVRKEMVRLSDVVNRSLEASRPLIEAQGQELTISLPPAPLWLHADPVRMAQIITNLLNNAAKYTQKEGHIWLTATQEGDEAVICVKDDGIGIDKSLLPRVFDLFTQGNRALDRAQGGLGIGLTLVKSLTEMHGGKVEARSDGIGKGSTFSIRMPATMQATPQVASDLKPQVDRPWRVLVIEDNIAAAKILVRLLKAIGNHEVEVAYDGESGLKLAKSFQPEVVLLDIGLPGMDGYEVARRLRKSPQGDLPLVAAVSGYGQEEDRRRSQEAGFDEHLLKPVGLDVMQGLFRHTKLGRK